MAKRKTLKDYYSFPDGYDLDESDSYFDETEEYDSPSFDDDYWDAMDDWDEEDQKQFLRWMGEEIVIGGMKEILNDGNREQRRAAKKASRKSANKVTSIKKGYTGERDVTFEELEKIKKDKETYVDVIDIFIPFMKEGIDSDYYDLKKIVKGKKTTVYRKDKSLQMVHDLIGRNMADFKSEYGFDPETGKQKAYMSGDVQDGSLSPYVEMAFTRDKLSVCSCTRCHKKHYNYWTGKYILSDDSLDEDEMCEHELVVLYFMFEWITSYKLGSATDKQALDLFSAFRDAEEDALDQVSDSDDDRKGQEVYLAPRISCDKSNIISLSFRVGIKGGKSYVLKKIPELLTAVDDGTGFSLGKNVSIDFSHDRFDSESTPWLTLLRRRLDEVAGVNRTLVRRAGWHRPTQIKMQSQETLTGALLDRFYDIAEGHVCEYKGPTGSGTSVNIGYSKPKISLEAEPIKINGKFLGVSVTGEMPLLLEGTVGYYSLDENMLSRLTDEDMESLKPFFSLDDSTGRINFNVGGDTLAEFYYRLVPEFIKNPYVDFIDRSEEVVASYLPVEPEFLFRLDTEDDQVRCDTFVTYGEESYPLLSRDGIWSHSITFRDVIGSKYDFGKQKRKGNVNEHPNSALPDVYRDERQELRVNNILEKYFPIIDEKEDDRIVFYDDGTEESLYRILTEGIDVLERYGEVQGTESFGKYKARPIPQIQVGVSVESNLMELSVISQDMSPDELLEVLQSYRQKKKYHKLKSGDFVTLADDDTFNTLEQIMDGMNITLDQSLKGKIRLPLYRALYLDKMLGDHEELVANRDRTYRHLVRNFHSIKDTEYEVPEELTGILRPYQEYGYKWLRTLIGAGFGGILADEMGLGKTLQTIAVIKALKDEASEPHDEPAVISELKPALVVCPASLVYNWVEEFNRFSPSLDVVAVAGTADVRHAILASNGEAVPVIKKRGRPKKTEAVQAAKTRDVYITSYDLLRSDVEIYEKMDFSLMVIDEAQYIKNQKAALTKAVKIIHADRRLALTGTPIENRLAELWSIFDFLMPGFLYKYSEFSTRFETPIVKGKNEEITARLKNMVGPFILRRLKTDVLKDLPEKLEEVRYARFDTEQRRVYDGQVVHMKEILAGTDPSMGEDKIKILAELTKIRQICCDPVLLFDDYTGGSTKREACMELITNAMSAGHRMLVFSQFVSMLELLEEDLKAAGIEHYKIVGATPKEKRLKLVHSFNDNDVPVFLISLKAGGTGLNLTGADMVIHYDPWWNLAAQNQATDRAHRIGQKKKVTVYRMIVKDSIEEKILKLQEDKKDLADAILSGESKSLASLSAEELMGLLG